MFCRFLFRSLILCSCFIWAVQVQAYSGDIDYLICDIKVH